MYSHSRMLIFVFCILMSPAAFAQNSRFNGIWVAPIIKAAEPGFLEFTLTVAGDTLTGTLSDTGARANPFNGKVEDGHITITFPKQQAPGGMMERSFTGTLKTAERLDLVEEFRIVGHKLVRKPGATVQPNTLEGEWVEEGRPGPMETLPVFVFHPEGETLSGEVLEHEMRDGHAGPLVHSPLTNGTVHGNQVSFGYISASRNPLTYTGTLTGERLVVTTELKKPHRAVRVEDSASGTGFSAESVAGTWVAPITKGTGPGFLVYRFTVNGNVLTGTMSDKGGPADSFTGKVENGHLSFSLPKQKLKAAEIEEFYTGTLKDAKHLDLTEDLRMYGFQVTRKPGTQAGASALEGEWMFAGAPTMPHYVIHVQGEKLTGEVLDHDVHDGIVGAPLISPISGGALHGNEFSFDWVGKRNMPMHSSGTMLGDHLVMNSSTTHAIRAVRIAGPGSGAVEQPAGMDKGKMGPFRALGRLAMEAVKRNDMATANTLCEVLERVWDEGEQDLHKTSAGVWDQIDHAMDGFVHPILDAAGSPPDPATLDAVYWDFVGKLKLAD